MTADNTRFADHHTRTVVYREIFADLCTRVDIDSRLRMSQLGDDTWYNGHAQLVQFMSDTVVRHRVDTWIAEYHLTIVRSRRVVVEHRLHISIEQPFDLWQRVDELQGQFLGLVVHLSLRAHLLTVLTELQSMGYLLHQLCHQFFHVYTDEVRADSLVGLSLIEIVGKDDVLHQSHDFLHLLNRWQRCLGSGHHPHLLLCLLR